MTYIVGSIVDEVSVPSTRIITPDVKIANNGMTLSEKVMAAKSFEPTDDMFVDIEGIVYGFDTGRSSGLEQRTAYANQYREAMAHAYGYDIFADFHNTEGDYNKVRNNFEKSYGITLEDSTIDKVVDSYQHMVNNLAQDCMNKLQKENPTGFAKLERLKDKVGDERFNQLMSFAVKDLYTNGEESVRYWNGLKLGGVNPIKSTASYIMGGISEMGSGALDFFIGNYTSAKSHIRAAGNNYKAAAFTLVEMLVVMGIVGLLAAMILPATKSVRDSARIAVTKNNIKQIGLANMMYNRSYGDNWFAQGESYYRQGEPTHMPLLKEQLRNFIRLKGKDEEALWTDSWGFELIYCEHHNYKFGFRVRGPPIVDKDGKGKYYNPDSFQLHSKGRDHLTSSVGISPKVWDDIWFRPDGSVGFFNETKNEVIRFSK